MQASQTKIPAVYRIVASLGMLSLLAACGYKGPLYMPPPPEPEESLTTPPQQQSGPTAMPASSDSTRPDAMQSEEPDTLGTEPGTETLPVQEQ